ncbi:substrate-binding domain-containing protein [Brooklawnia cerclae]|uniref:LacI family transcriptional regulator n=1 Tax=Brooklawnia cerclae TaxID=349934 RepID=A0ABX0SAK0_9ACTN|nr:LacI family transcriptional regulator [Brooklawnia cerclae]
MLKAATIRDVAREAGVSIAVVSRAINPGSGPVAPETRDRVLAAIEKLDYRPRAAARELQAGATTTIALMVPDLINPFFSGIADAIVYEARSRGVHVMVLTTQEDPHLEAELVQTLRTRSVGALIVAPTDSGTNPFGRLVDLGIHVICVDRELDDSAGIDVVTIDNENSARTATQHLLQLGHERIAIITGPQHSSSARSRLVGFRGAMADAGVEVDEQLVRPIAYRGTLGSDAVGSLLALPHPPTALIVANGAQAFNSVRRVRQSGIGVPDDLSLVVFDDNPWTDVFSPALTVIRQPVKMMAMHSTQIAVSRLQGDRPPAPVRIELRAELVHRSSCRPLREPPVGGD